MIGGRADSATPLDQRDAHLDDLVVDLRDEAVPAGADPGPGAGAEAGGGADAVPGAPPVVLSAWLRRATPSPTPWRRGTLSFRPGRFDWQPRRPGLQPNHRSVTLGSIDVTRVRTTTVREVLRVDRSCTVFGLATDVELLELAVLPADLPATRAALRGARSLP